MKKIDFDDVDIAMLIAGAIAIASLIVLGALALARGKEKKPKGGLPHELN